MSEKIECIIEYDSKNNKIICKKYMKNGHIHNDNDKSAIKYYDKCGRLVEKFYYKNNLVHREGDKPAIIKYTYNENDERVLSAESYYQNDNLYREDDKPTFILYYSCGKLREETYTSNEMIHREGDKPANIKYYESGNLQCESYYINSTLHRENDNPSQIFYYDNDLKQIHKEIYHIYGIVNRINNELPIEITYSLSGECVTNIYKNLIGNRVETINLWDQFSKAAR